MEDVALLTTQETGGYRMDMRADKAYSSEQEQAGLTLSELLDGKIVSDEDERERYCEMDYFPMLNEFHGLMDSRQSKSSLRYDSQSIEFSPTLFGSYVSGNATELCIALAMELWHHRSWIGLSCSFHIFLLGTRWTPSSRRAGLFVMGVSLWTLIPLDIRALVLCLQELLFLAAVVRMTSIWLLSGRWRLIG
jgi:hypothetical protein